MRKKQLSEKCLVLQIVICDGEIMFVCNIYSAWHAAAGLLVECVLLHYLGLALLDRLLPIRLKSPTDFFIVSKVLNQF